MSLIARRLIASRNLLRCSVNTAKLLTINNLNLTKLAPLQVAFQVSKFNYSTDNSNVALKEKFDQLTKKDKIVVFMKGTPEKPMCGFSKAVCDILRFHGASFETHNVLADESIRNGIKEYTDWPTIPQIFFKGEFIGGCDILLEMHKSGDLVDELEKIGIKSKALEAEEPTKKE